MLTVNTGVQRQIQGLATAAQIKQAAVTGGMRSMRDAGIEKVLAGVTTIEEIQRVTMRATDAQDMNDPQQANELTEVAAPEPDVPAPLVVS